MEPKYERLGKLREFDPLTGEEIDLGLITYRITASDPERGPYVRIVKINEGLEREDPDMVKVLLARYVTPPA